MSDETSANEIPREEQNGENNSTNRPSRYNQYLWDPNYKISPRTVRYRKQKKADATRSTANTGNR